MVSSDLISVDGQSSIPSVLLGQPTTLSGMSRHALNSNLLQSSGYSFDRALTRSSPQTGIRRLGNHQPNTLTGTIGNDVLEGRNGNDSLIGNGGDDRLLGGDGNDILRGGEGNDRLEAGRGNDRVSGDRGNDTLLGGENNDILVGGEGNDQLHGGTGIDKLTGNQGRDRFYLNLGWGGSTLAQADTITDFTRGQDLLHLNSGLTRSTLAMSQDAAGNTIIRHQATGEYLLVLTGVRGLGIEDFANPGTATTALPSTAAIATNPVKFSSSDSEAAIAAKGAAKIKLGSQTLYIGTQQVSSTNQNPIIASFDPANPSNRWVRTDYEVTGTDGRGYGLFWSGTGLYGVFSVDGTQGTIAQDFRRVSGSATQPWLRSYGKGGGAKIAVLAKLNPTNGAMTHAVYLSAVLSNGNSNAISNLQVESGATLTLNNGTLSASSATINGTYIHNRNGGTIPTATWGASSECRITGVVSNAPTGLAGQTFGNLTWNCTAQNTDVAMLTGTGSLSLAGNFTISSTGTNILNFLSANATATLNIGGNLTLNAGSFRLSNILNGVATANIGGNLNQSAGTFMMGFNTGQVTISLTGSHLQTGGTFSMGATLPTAALYRIQGNFSATGGNFGVGGGASGILEFTGAAAQTYNKSNGKRGYGRYLYPPY
ncbi:MAG: hypothetical protein HC881_15410 [Leptolyngbyaceae cyanobacterium SL_7_1]|nr:hypothetical protein [Leptolyngbyaceae cyanobacterium SL_7_1]